MIAASFALAAVALLLARPEGPSPLVFVHVEANVDGASGGHTALRVGDYVYHFQQGEDRLLRLVRDDWSGFRHVYAGLQNRTLHLAQLDVAADDVERIARRFSRAYVEQQSELERAARRRDDALWLEAVRDGASPPPLRGAGLFADPASPPPQGADEGAAELRAAVAAALGPEFLREELARIDAALAAFRLADGSTDLEPWRELLSRRSALRVLDGETPLAPEAVIDAVIGDADPAPLADAERDGLGGVRAAQRAAILALLRSARPDRGFALHVAIARERAAARSLAEGRLVLLDPFPDDASICPPESQDDEREAHARLARRAQRAVTEIRAAVLGAGSYDEARFNALEDVAARGREARRGAAGGAVRVHTGRMVPSRGRVVAAAPAVPDVARRAASARADADRGDLELRARFAYGLFERNCVTELVRLLDSAFPDDAAVAAALGARLEPGARLGFIPFVFHEQVVARLRVAREETILNHRRDELARVEAAEPGALTSLREATTLTSTIYEPRASDGAFLFFTDDVLWRRPLLGAANLGWGVGQGLAGVVTAPFDRGRRLRAGFHGAFFSLPELFFGNVRKGSFRYVEGLAPPQSR